MKNIKQDFFIIIIDLVFIMTILQQKSCIFLTEKLSNLRCEIPTNSTSFSFAMSLIVNLNCFLMPITACKISVLIVL